MAGQRVRIIDIAQELGVSTATVSNVIHGKTQKLSGQTVHRVQEALERRQYIPSMAGILLAQNSSRIVGVAVNPHEKYQGRPLEDGFISSAVSHLSAALEGAGYFLMVKVTQDWNEIARFASMWNMEGLIALGFCRQDCPPLRRQLHIPLVVLDGALSVPGQVCSMIADDYDGGVQMGTHFREQGYTRALCVADGRTAMESGRVQGFCSALGGRTVEVLEVPTESQARRRFYESHLDQLCSCRAIFAVSDIYAAELMVFLQEKGLRIPEDLAVAGFDDSPLCRQVYPPLTSVRLDQEERARRAVELLQRLKAGAEEAETITLPVALVKRRSTVGRIQQRRGRLYP